VGIAVLMTQIGLSPALGAFLAGVVLASSEYRHELESDIEPFKGLLLGLFFYCCRRVYRLSACGISTFVRDRLGVDFAVGKKHCSVPFRQVL
jgi:hypothetical protein